MAKFEKAYSLELGYMIDAEKAYELFWEGIIKDKRAFQCLGTNCQAQITCVNIDKERSEMKQVPHFNCYGEHDINCEILKELQEAEAKKHVTSKKRSMRYIDNCNDIFSFNRPKRDSIIVKSKINESFEKHQEIKERIKEDYKKNESRSTTYYSIKPLISKFEKYYYKNTLGKNYITIKGNKVSYKRMFVDIKNKEIEEVEKYYRIYYGEGRIYKSKKNPDDFVVFITNGFGKESLKTMIYISDKVIKESFMRNKWIKDLNYLCDHKEFKVVFYVNCKPKYNNEIITLPLYNLDYFDYRIIK